MRTIWCGQVWRAEGKHQLRRVAQRRVMPVRPADGDHQRTPAAVAQRSDPVGEVFGGKVLAALVEQDQRGAGAEVLPQPVGFLALALGGGLGAAFGGLVKPENSRPMAGPLFEKRSK